MNYDQIDESFLPMNEVVETLGDIQGRITDWQEGVQMDIDKVELDLPIQLEILVDENNEVLIGGTPPLYYVETSFMPVFHQISLVLTVSENKNGTT